MREIGTLICWATARKEKQLQEERKRTELLARKRKLAFSRNSIQQDYCRKELEREDWNRDYVDYLQSQFIKLNDIAGFTEEELTAPIMRREEFERQQVVEIYREKATRAGGLWDDALKGISGVTHKWKWEYMDYLEDIKYRDTADMTLEEAKEEILSYEQFAEVKDTEKTIQEQASDIVETSKIVALQADSEDESQATVVSEEGEVEITETEEKVSEDTEVIPEAIDYTKLSMEERALLLPVPTDDYSAEYNAYCQRMGYTEEKMKSIRYKMDVYDEFMAEYQYRKKHYGVRDDFKSISVSEKSKEVR